MTDMRLPGGHTEDNRPPRYVEVDDNGDTRIVYRASGWGACDVSLAAMSIGEEGAGTPAFMQEKYDQGHKFEPVIVEMCQDGQIEGVDGGVFLIRNIQTGDGEQHVCKFVIGDTEINGDWFDVVARTALDGIGIVTSLGNGHVISEQACVIEIKALGKTYWDQFVKGKLRLYDWQVSTQMHGSGLPVLVVAGQKKELAGGKIIIAEVKAKLYHEAPVSKGEMVGRMRKREAVVELARTGQWDGTCAGPHVYPCPHYHLHAGGEPTVKKSWDQELFELVEEDRRLQALAKETTEAHKAVKAKIKAWMQANDAMTGKTAVEGNDKTYVVEWYKAPRDGYTVPAGTVEYVLIKAASRADLKAIAGETVTLPGTAEEVFVDIANDRTPRGVPPEIAARVAQTERVRAEEAAAVVTEKAPPAKPVEDVKVKGAGRMML